MTKPIDVKAGSQLHQAVMKAVGSSAEVAIAAQSFLEGRDLTPEQWQVEISVRLLPPPEPSAQPKADISDMRSIATVS